jgi:pyruvate ferredoxin oxidoreductase delta subunit
MSCKGCNNVKCSAANKERKVVSPDVSWKDITVGGTITDAGNAELFNTGDWRSMKPIWIEDKCKQCLLCYPVCPDTAILVDKDGKRMDFNYEHCKGCGICAKVCPFKAIDFVEEI